MNRNSFMLQALNAAKTAFENDEVPIGSVIVYNGEVIAKAFNQNIRLKDPMAHAEILALRKAVKIRKSSKLENCDIYITLEPCAMCAAAISFSRIRRIYYGAQDKKFGAIENGARIFHNSSCYYTPEIYSGINESGSKKLLSSFFKQKR